MNITLNIDYKGNSKVLKRLCWAVNWLSSNAAGDMAKEVYDANDDGIVDNAEMVNGHSVYADVPSDAKFTDTIYDDTVINGRVRANMNNINLLMETIFNAEYYYLTDSDGNQIVDSNGNPLYSARYKSKLDDIGLKVVDGKLCVVYEE